MRNIILRVCLLAIITCGQQEYSACTVQEVTNPSYSDGFGAQFQIIIAAVIYAELNNCKYVYTPFQSMEHNYINDPDFLAKKEQLINFIGNFEINEKHTACSSINYLEFFRTHATACANSHALKKIKKIFRANKKTDNYFNNSNLNIAIHLRRPNPHDNRVPGTNTPDTVYLTIINRLRVLYGSAKPLFHLYSQGNRENFKVFNAHDIVLHINESIEDSFTEMVLADVLVVGTSAFSNAAGFLSEGIVYYIPFWNTPLPHWTPVDVLLRR